MKPLAVVSSCSGDISRRIHGDLWQLSVHCVETIIRSMSPGNITTETMDSVFLCFSGSRENPASVLPSQHQGFMVTLYGISNFPQTSKSDSPQET